MIVSLNGVPLNSAMAWVDRFDAVGVGGFEEVHFSVTGRLVRRPYTHAGGRRITLEATEEYGWLPYSTVKTLWGLASLSPSLRMPFVYGTEPARSVVFVREDDTPALQLKPLVSRVVHADTDFFIGTINLLEVE